MLGYSTKPTKVGAPLPVEMAEIEEPGPGPILAELTRAKVELMYAIARHRKAWSRMRLIKREREADAAKKGVPAYLDNDTLWKIATGDVSWWRDEMTAQATTVAALTTMAEQCGLHLGQEWHENHVTHRPAQPPDVRPRPDLLVTRQIPPTPNCMIR